MKRSENFVLSEVAGTKVLVPVGDAAVTFPGMVTMNGAGTLIWEQLEQEKTLEQLAEAMMEHYDVSKETALADAAAFVEKLIPIGAILEN
ncbi:MAG: PqqD family protein [Oscillospiraceae bacterium]|nr:PqqD family protein [Oscillospiraceae bacterium]